MKWWEIQLLLWMRAMEKSCRENLLKEWGRRSATPRLDDMDACFYFKIRRNRCREESSQKKDRLHTGRKSCHIWSVALREPLRGGAQWRQRWTGHFSGEVLVSWHCLICLLKQWWHTLWNSKLTFLSSTCHAVFTLVSYINHKCHSTSYWKRWVLIYPVFHLPWNSEVGAGNDVTPKLTVLQYNKLENQYQQLANPVLARLDVVSDTRW